MSAHGLLRRVVAAFLLVLGTSVILRDVLGYYWLEAHQGVGYGVIFLGVAIAVLR